MMKQHMRKAAWRPLMFCLFVLLIFSCTTAALAWTPGATLYVDTDNDGPLYLRQGPSKKTDHIGIYEEGTPEQIFDAPQQPRTQDFLKKVL